MTVPQPAGPDPAPRERLRLSARSVILAVAMLGATLAALRLVAASTRVLGWVIAAIAIASMLGPAVRLAQRWMPRFAAVLLVLVVVLGGAAVVTYGVVHSVMDQMHDLQRSAPAAARELERSDRYGELARNFDLARRTETFVDSVPERLQGGNATQVLRSAATRGVAFLATGVLSIFFLLHGPRLAEGASKQIADPARRERVSGMVVRAYRRTVSYSAGSILMAIAAGLFGYLVASMADVRGAAPLGLWVGLWDLVPIVGALIGALPIVLLALVFSGARALTVLAAFVLYQAFEYLVLQRRVERRSLHVGPFLTVVGGLIGIELYGIGGGLVAVLVLTFGVALADEVLPE